MAQQGTSYSCRVAKQSNEICESANNVLWSTSLTYNELLWIQEAAMRARAKQANLETKKANEILLAFKKLDAQRELEADAAIAGQ